MTDLDPTVRELAAALGVATEYIDWRDKLTHVDAETVLAVLDALGVSARTPTAATAALADLTAARWRRMLPATVVARAGRTTDFWVHVPHGDPVEVWVEVEGGDTRHDLVQQDRWVDPAVVDGSLVGEATFALPDLPLGWHVLGARSGDRSASATLVVTPDSLGLPARLGAGRAWGFLVQLYQLRSHGSWGVGDLADLARLAAWSARDHGAGFVLVNPLHAASPRAPMEPSPYLPTTRRFANPMYLRVEDVAEYAALDPDSAAVVDGLRAELDAAMGDRSSYIDRDAAWAAKRTALTMLASQPLPAERAAALAAFRGREGAALEDFAVWSALVDEHGTSWREWPAELHDPRGPAVAAERERLAAGVELHARLQWWLDEQLASTQEAALAAGMTIGVLHDLAVGVDPNGFDTWALQDFLVHGVSVGAPPDAYNQQGQSWSQPPWHPTALAASGYAPYRDMLRAVLRHAGGVRVDHVLGLFRLWLVPDGSRPTEGTYLRYDYEALLGILALEAHRAGALVIGEDLGVVEPWVRETLRERGIAGTSILWFERDWGGAPLPPEHWRELCLASVTTHDLPPTAGYLRGEHVRIREELGLLTRSADEERAADAADQETWLRTLRERGLLAPGANVDATVEGLHRYVAATPARLVGVALPDAVGDVRAQNQPGTHNEYPNWRVPLSDATGRPVLLEDLPSLELLRTLARAVSGEPR